MFIVPIVRHARHPAHLSRLLDDSLDRYFAASTATERPAARSPVLDVAETDAAYVVTLEMPGVAKDDVKISVEGRQVSVQAQSQRAEDRKEGQQIVYRERTVASYARSFTLPAEVAQGEGGAKLENGVLTLTLPKRSASGATQIAIN